MQFSNRPLCTHRLSQTNKQAGPYGALFHQKASIPVGEISQLVLASAVASEPTPPVLWAA